MAKLIDVWNGRTVDIEQEQVDDLWHIAMDLKNRGHNKASEAVLHTWHLAHDMQYALHNLIEWSE